MVFPWRKSVWLWEEATGYKDTDLIVLLDQRIIEGSFYVVRSVECLAVLVFVSRILFFSTIKTGSGLKKTYESL